MYVWVFPQIGGWILPPNGMVYFMENPIKMDDLEAHPYFWKHPYGFRTPVGVAELSPDTFCLEPSTSTMVASYLNEEFGCINCSRKVIVRPGQSPSSWTACTSAPGRKTYSIRLNPVTNGTSGIRDEIVSHFTTAQKVIMQMKM